MKTIGYARCSTIEQSKSGLGMEDQRKKIIEYCSAKGLQLIEIIEDNGESGGTPIDQRPGGKRLCEMIRNPKSGINGIVMLKLDRGWRDAHDCLSTIKTWKHKKIILHFVEMGIDGLDQNSAAGSMFIGMSALFSEFEKNAIRDRTIAALNVKREHGEKLGGPVPYGYDVEISTSCDAKGRPVRLKRLIMNPEEQDVLRVIFALREKGKGPRRIANILNEANIPTKQKKGIWIHTQVNRILKRVKKDDNTRKVQNGQSLQIDDQNISNTPI